MKVTLKTKWQRGECVWVAAAIDGEFTWEYVGSSPESAVAALVEYMAVSEPGCERRLTVVLTKGPTRDVVHKMVYCTTIAVQHGSVDSGVRVDELVEAYGDTLMESLVECAMMVLRVRWTDRKEGQE